MSEFINPYLWSSNAQLLALVTPFLISGVGLIMSGRIAAGDGFDVLFDTVRSSPWVERQKTHLGTLSFKSRWMLVCTIGGVLLCSRFHIRRGLLDKSEIERIPSRLKTCLLWSIWLNFIGLLLLSIIVGLYKFAEAV